MHSYETAKLEAVLKEAVLKAIKQVGLGAFLETSFFGSNESKEQKKAA